MRKAQALWILLLLAGLFGPLRVHAATFQGLGFLQTPGSSFAEAMSADAPVVVGSASSGLSPTESFIWKPLVGMQSLGMAAGDGYSTALAVSADGMVVVGDSSRVVAGSGTFHQAYRWTNGTGMVGLGRLEASDTSAKATGVSASGDIIVGYSSRNSNVRAFRWTSGTGMVNLGFLGSGYTTSAAMAVAANGNVVVGWSAKSGRSQAFRWTSSLGMQPLGYLPDIGPDSQSSAQAVSSDGNVVVGSSISLKNGQIVSGAFRWTQEEGMVGLGELPNGRNGGATAISADGRVIVGSSTVGGVLHAWIWTEEHGMRDLRSVLVNDYGLNLTKWDLLTVEGISADGTMIVGTGDSPTSTREAWAARNLNVPPTGGFSSISFHRATMAAWQATASDSIDAPISLNPAAVKTQPSPLVKVARGVVADGVTPLVIKLSLGDEDVSAKERYRLTFQVVDSSGTPVIHSATIESRVRTLRGGIFQASSFLDLDLAGTAIAYLTHFDADDFLGSTIQGTDGTGVINNGSATFKVEVGVFDTLTDRQIASKHFEVTRPPIALVHGYNSSATSWTGSFLTPLSATGRIIVPVNYGVSGGDLTINTYGSLEYLAMILDQTLQTSVIEALQPEWAVTRMDAVGHSQGGVLLRMLANQNSNNWVPAFRNAGNVYRGRFHRAVTIGAPHNGSRLVRYMLGQIKAFHGRHNLTPLDLLTLDKLELLLYSPHLIGLSTGLLQAKFDPWNIQIQKINDPAGEWTPDADGRFHLIRTVVDEGYPPKAYARLPVQLLGLARTLVSETVLPYGYDGIVDFESQGAGGVFSSQNSNQTTVNPQFAISHVGGEAGELIGGVGTVGQTSSAIVARLSLALLDLASAGADSTFDQIVQPARLPNTLRDRIDSLSPYDNFGFESGDYIVAEESQMLGIKAMSSVTYSSATYRLQLPTPVSAGKTPLWKLNVVGGAASWVSRVQLSFTNPERTAVEVTYDSTLVGDVVLQVFAEGADGKSYLSQGILVARLNEGASLVGIASAEAAVSMEIGSAIVPSLLGIFSDGSRREIFVQPAELTVIPGGAGVVDASLGAYLVARQPGGTTVQLGYQGFVSSMSIETMATTSSAEPKLSLTPISPFNIRVEWPFPSLGWSLEYSQTLSPTDWHPAPLSTPGGMNQSTDFPFSNRLFMRLRKH